MNVAADIIRRCLAESQIKQVELAKMMNEHPRNISEQLRRNKDIKFNKLTKMLELIGYEIIIARKG